MGRKPKSKEEESSGVGGPPEEQSRLTSASHASTEQESSACQKVSNRSLDWNELMELEQELGLEPGRSRENTGETGNPAEVESTDGDKSEDKTASTGDLRGAKRGLPVSAEKSAPAPPKKRSYADQARLNDSRIVVTVCKLKDGEVENLSHHETDNLVDRITEESWDLAEPIRIHKTALIGGRASVHCADEQAVKWIKELVPKIDTT